MMREEPQKEAETRKTVEESKKKIEPQKSLQEAILISE